MILDLPPGTGDVQLTICQEVELSGAVGVTTPSKLAIADARKGIEMFSSLGVPTIAMVENMSYFEVRKMYRECICDDTAYDLLFRGGVSLDAYVFVEFENEILMFLIFSGGFVPSFLVFFGYSHDNKQKTKNETKQNSVKVVVNIIHLGKVFMIF